MGDEIGGAIADLEAEHPQPTFVVGQRMTDNETSGPPRLADEHHYDDGLAIGFYEHIPNYTQVVTHHVQMASNELTQEMLDGKRLANELQIPERTLGQWRYLGKGPAYVRVGNHVRYRRADVDAWIEANTVAPGVA